MGKVQASTIPKKFVDLSKLVIVIEIFMNGLTVLFFYILLLLEIEKERPCCCLVHCKKKSWTHNFFTNFHLFLQSKCNRICIPFPYSIIQRERTRRALWHCRLFVGRRLFLVSRYSPWLFPGLFPIVVILQHYLQVTRY